MRLHHPISLPDLVEALILDRLEPSRPGDRDRPCLRFLCDVVVASEIASGMTSSARDGEAFPGAVLTLDRGYVASAVRLIHVEAEPEMSRIGGGLRELDLRIADTEFRARAPLLGFRDRIVTVTLSSDAIDALSAAWSEELHPDDDGTGRWTAMARGILDDLIVDPRRIEPDEAAYCGARDSSPAW